MHGSSVSSSLSPICRRKIPSRGAQSQIALLPANPEMHEPQLLTLHQARQRVPHPFRAFCGMGGKARTSTARPQSSAKLCAPSSTTMGAPFFPRFCGKGGKARTSTAHPQSSAKMCAPSSTTMGAPFFPRSLRKEWESTNLNRSPSIKRENVCPIKHDNGCPIRSALLRKGWESTNLICEAL